MLGTASRTLLQKMVLQQGRSLNTLGQRCALRAALWLLHDAYPAQRSALQLSVPMRACTNTLPVHRLPKAFLDHETTLLCLQITQGSLPIPRITDQMCHDLLV